MEVQLKQHYSPNGLRIAMDIFNHPREFTANYRLLAIKFLLQFSTQSRRYQRDFPTQQQISAQALEMFDASLQQGVDTTSLEIADIFSTYFPGTGHDLLERIRVHEAVEAQQAQQFERGEWQPPVVAPVPTPTPRKPRTIYEDSQSVHDTNINVTVKHAITTLVQRYNIKTISNTDRQPILDNITETLKQHCPEKRSVVIEVMQRIRSDNAMFNIETTLEDALLAIWHWAHDPAQAEHTQEILSRLIEEFVEMRGYCASGHLSRLVNVIQGFSADDDLQIRISQKDQCRAQVFGLLTKALQECDDQAVQEAIVNGDTKSIAYRDYLRKTILDYEWCEIGKDNIVHVYNAANQFAGEMIF